MNEVRARLRLLFFIFFCALRQGHEYFSSRDFRLESGKFIHAARQWKRDLSAFDDRSIKTRDDLQSLIRSGKSQWMRLSLIVQPIRHLLDVWRHVVVVIHSART